MRSQNPVGFFIAGMAAIGAGLLLARNKGRATAPPAAPLTPSPINVWLSSPAAPFGNGNPFAGTVQPAVQSIHFVNVPPGVSPSARDMSFFESDAAGRSFMP